MCIIVAKKSGIKMPSKDILQNCFTCNPDGAGIMLAANGEVHGFKGLMTFDKFYETLSFVEKKFGNLDKFSVVMHFRIGTHGTNVPDNTHPFPLNGGYRKMRKQQWVAKQGFAHNGIIHKTSSDPDIKKFNVSDTMVFGKKFIVPIARYADITKDDSLMDMLFNVADSKLAFLNGEGKLETRGSFIEENGILYSNSSYEGYRAKSVTNITSLYKPYGGWDFDPYYHIGDFDKLDYKNELAEEYGFIPVESGSLVMKDEEIIEEIQNDDIYTDGYDLYRFDDEYFDFIPHLLYDEYTSIILPEEIEQLV